MKKTYLFMGLAVLLWGTSTVVGQGIFGIAPCVPLCDPCEPVACDPCEPVCDPCDPCGNGNSGGNGSGGLFSPFTFGGWVESGVYTNSHGKRDNGPVHLASKHRNDFQMKQLYLFGEKEMNTRRGFDWGGRVDLAYGTDYKLMQTLDGTFDSDWGVNRSGYGMAAYQLFGTLGYQDLSVKFGKFATPIGWEAVASKDNFFYSHSLCFTIEPTSHTGIFGTFDVSDRLSISAGWTTGLDSSFKNPDDNSAMLAGVTYLLSDYATLYYWINAGKQYNGKTTLHDDFFIQSLCFEWALTNRFTYVLQYNLRNDNAQGGGARNSAYGINNHLLYKLTDKLSAGTRVEWLRDNMGAIDPDASDYGQVTFGLRWDPTEFLSIRPEVRYDWCRGGATPFADGTKKDQASGGFGMVVSF